MKREPTEEAVRKNDASIAKREKKDRESSIFATKVVSDAASCTCGCCTKVDSDRPLFCCRSLEAFSEDLLGNGQIMREFLSPFSSSNGCITENAVFQRSFLNKEVRGKFRFTVFSLTRCRWRRSELSKPGVDLSPELERSLSLAPKKRIGETEVE